MIKAMLTRTLCWSSMFNLLLISRDLKEALQKSCELRDPLRSRKDLCRVTGCLVVFNPKRSNVHVWKYIPFYKSTFFIFEVHSQLGAELPLTGINLAETDQSTRVMWAKTTGLRARFCGKGAFLPLLGNVMLTSERVLHPFGQMFPSSFQKQGYA